MQSNQENRLLFGHDPTPSLVAVEVGSDGSADFFHRADSGATAVESLPFTPYLWAAEPLEGYSHTHLEGGMELGTLISCPDTAAWLEARKQLSAQRIPHFSFPDLNQQALAWTGRTLFKDLPFSDLRRMQIEVRFDPKNRFLLAVGLSCRGQPAHIRINDSEHPPDGELALLEFLEETVLQEDPDVLEGHDLFRGLLPGLLECARRQCRKLKLGRGGAAVRSRNSRLQIAEKTLNYTRCQARGRHFIDTYLLALHYDVSARELEGYELADLAEHFRFPSDSPANPGEELAQRLQWTATLAAILSPSYFAQTRIFPLNYQEILLRGNATRIDSLFLREYLRAGHGIPDVPATRSFAGGYTDIFEHGLLGPVGHCDIASLYPSILLRYKYFPASDRLKVFAELLGDLRAYRLEAKERLRQLEASGHDSAELHETRGSQQAFKILINSFYGYLGFGQGHFADFDAAEKVTAKGRELLKEMVEHLRKEGLTVVEIDTDGIYFLLPKEGSLDAVQASLQAALPSGIEVEFDATYRAMFSYKAKNYALLTDDHQLVLKGGALKSRGMEPYLRQFLHEFLKLLLEKRGTGAERLLEQYRERISSGREPVEWFMKTDTLQESLAAYRKKIDSSSRGRAAAYEVALRTGQDLGPGDSVRYYITGTKKKVPAHEFAKPIEEWDPEQRDENTAYYLGKLDDLWKRFSTFLPKP